MEDRCKSVHRTRLLLLFWGSILLFTMMFVNDAFTSSTSYNPIAINMASSTQEGEFIGSETCGMCHSEFFNSWSETMHATPTSYVYENREGAICWTCHVNGTDYETGNPISQDLIGFTATNDPVDEGISCETCHGPYQGGAGPDHMPTTLEAELCGECHSPYHGDMFGDAYEYWSLSEHATSQIKLLEIAIENPYCMQCNTAEGTLLDATTLAEVENGITCAVCHDPHSNDHIPQLREATVFELCVSCHSHETDTGPHYGRLTPNGKEVDCATCHMFGLYYSARNVQWTQNVNHSMGVTIASCGQVTPDIYETTCHANPEAAWAAKDELITQGAAKIAITEGFAEEAFATFETANKTDVVNVAKLEGAMDVYESLDDIMGEISHAGTFTFHDPLLLEQLLDEATFLAQDLIRLSEEALIPPETTLSTTTTTPPLITTTTTTSATSTITPPITTETRNMEPTVLLIRPNGGEIIQGIYEIRWGGNDPDGDNLIYTVSFSPNGGETWTQIASEVTGLSYQWNSSNFESGSNYLIKVEVFDGELTTEDVSDTTFTVELEKPPESDSNSVFIPSFELGEALGAILVLVYIGRWNRRKKN